jgi:hypothetical protein
MSEDIAQKKRSLIDSIRHLVYSHLKIAADIRALWVAASRVEPDTESVGWKGHIASAKDCNSKRKSAKQGKPMAIFEI